MIIKTVLVLTMTICSSSDITLRERLHEMEAQGWKQLGPIRFEPCEGWDTIKDGVYEEGECVTVFKRERIKKQSERKK